jgi:hypothetical protein
MKRTCVGSACGKASGLLVQLIVSPNPPLDLCQNSISFSLKGEEGPPQNSALSSFL